jgi:murein DD-endopeptidase MepM/ murein hydrolase activator NlpD
MGLAVMLNSTDPAEVTSQMNTIDSLMNKQTELLKDLKEARAQMVAEEAKVEKAKEAVAVQRKEARANLVRRQGLERSAAEARAEVAKLVVHDRAARAQAASARRADEAQLSSLKKQEDRIRAEILERARRQRASGGGSVYNGDSGGFLYRPVPGGITSSFGYRKHPIYGYWGLHDGTDFSTPCGIANRAAGSGTVISRYWSDVYGNRLYLDLGQVNGKNMTVVYNHLSGYSASTGERVSRGEVIGYAGSTGWSTGCHLHFTVLLDGSPVNPMNYL